MNDLPKDVRPAYTVGAALTTARILRYLGSTGEPVRLVRIAADLQLNPSTCLNILRTLTDEGLVKHQAQTKTYALGLGIIELARSALMRLEQRDLIQPLLDDFSRRHGVTVMLWQRIEEAQLVLTAYSMVGAIVQIRALIGTRVPLLNGSMGRVIAAFGDLDEATLRARFAEVQWQGAIDFETFMEEARVARARRWAIDSGTADAARHGMSAPVIERGPLQRIVSAALFANQLPPNHLQTVGAELAELASEIGRCVVD